ncbi:hypothetical protein WJX73_007814 [Symbiochloris irregularis]|uniref:Uncharacterized protein n=1 Tax=Symbiochloris irregularis TaxID=706552 RepID=A0AAW1PME7_9CHLO
MSWRSSTGYLPANQYLSSWLMGPLIAGHVVLLFQWGFFVHHHANRANLLHWVISAILFLHVVEMGQW